MVVMEEDATQLSEVVVTALGIKKAKRSVGYSVQEIDSEELNRDGNQDVLGAIQGKIAGVNINTTSGAAGAGSSIIIRGITSLSNAADNQPLFIVDGGTPSVMLRQQEVYCPVQVLMRHHPQNNSPLPTGEQILIRKT